MRLPLAQVVMVLAVHCLGDRRGDWALAMEVEFETACEDGKPIAFAFGCLTASWRQLPAHEEGRFTIASHLLAFMLIIPTAAFLVARVLGDFPHSYLGELGDHGLPLLSEGNRFAVPPLITLLVLIAGAHLRLAWVILERDWVRVAATAMLIAAMTVALLILSTIGFNQSAPALIQLAALSVVLAGIGALARWHARSLSDPVGTYA